MIYDDQLSAKNDNDASEARLRRRILDAVSDRLGDNLESERLEASVERQLAVFDTATVRDYVELLVVRGVLKELRG